MANKKSFKEGLFDFFRPTKWKVYVTLLLFFLMVSILVFVLLLVIIFAIFTGRINIFSAGYLAT